MSSLWLRNQARPTSSSRTPQLQTQFSNSLRCWSSALESRKSNIPTKRGKGARNCTTTRIRNCALTQWTPELNNAGLKWNPRDRGEKKSSRDWEEEEIRKKLCFVQSRELLRGVFTPWSVLGHVAASVCGIISRCATWTPLPFVQTPPADLVQWRTLSY